MIEKYKEGDQVIKNILHLDDDILILSEVSKILTHYNLKLFSFTQAKEAELFVNKKEVNISLAIVDLFLEGDQGLNLSSEFIRTVLMPEKINYVRLTSAPRLVPKLYMGLAVFDKKEMFHNIDSLMLKIFSCL
jgi:DNA-binding NtrC family response regulator